MLLQHQQHCEQQLLELRKGQAAAHSTAKEAAAAASAARRAVEPVDSMRLEMADMQGCVAALQAATAGRLCIYCLCSVVCKRLDYSLLVHRVLPNSCC
jgi:hypothetical protein